MDLGRPRGVAAEQRPRPNSESGSIGAKPAVNGQIDPLSNEAVTAVSNAGVVA